jgi:hypothetical protein
MKTQIIHTVKEFSKLRVEWFKKDLKIGFIPTVKLPLKSRWERYMKDMLDWLKELGNITIL